LALGVLIILGLSLQAIVGNKIKTQIRGELQALLDADVAALTIWLEAQKANAQVTARNPSIVRQIGALARTARGDDNPRDKLLAALEKNNLEATLRPLLNAYRYQGFVVLDDRKRVLAATQKDLIGKGIPAGAPRFADEVLDGNAVVTRPYEAVSLMPNESGQLTTGMPTMFAAAPVAAEDGKRQIAVLALRIPPDQDFTRILSVARYGETGETYAFDKNGLMLSRSRFDEQLRNLGLISDRSMLKLELRDQGMDLTKGEPRPPRADNQPPPLTRMAADAVQERSDVDVTGYRDYRGVPSLGAWTWLPEYGFGVATEVDKAEAYQPLRALEVVFWVLFGLLAVSAVGLFFFSTLVERLHRSVRRAEQEVRQLGQYTLEEKIGSGGMGTVYRARHALLRRPTAVKLLSPEASAVAAARFEREVHQTCRLNHPNTVAIYDYGRSQDGAFYYAMEFVDGINLDALVRKHGPLPDGRVIAILTQVCGSLAEAHDIGLIHRDVKPANVMLTRRGGLGDFVKLLDFGLVKSLEDGEQAALTAAGAITGTPGYLSPEAVEDRQKMGPRSDLYSLGAVAYFLLTGRPVFEGADVMEICRQQINETPVPPSQRVSRPIAADLEAVILSCLAKRPVDRPATARELAGRLARCCAATPWSGEDAEAWWRNEPAGGPAAEPTYSTLEAFPRRVVTFSTLDPNKVEKPPKPRLA
jgi:hypothetical protein